MAITTLQSSLQLTFAFDAEKASTGLEPIKRAQTQVKSCKLTTAASPTSAGGGDQCVFQVRLLAPSSNETLDLSAAIENVVGDSNSVITRVKAIAFFLLGSEYIGPAGREVSGSPCTAIEVGGAGTHPWKGFFSNTSDALIVPNDGFAAIGTRGPAGFPVSSGMNDQLKITNPDSSYTAAYAWGLIGGAS